MITSNHRKCKSCGWVHFAVSRSYAYKHTKRYNEYAKERGLSFTTVDTYKQCHRCGGSYKNFEKAKSGDAPMGSTINPIMYERRKRERKTNTRRSKENALRA